MLGALDAVGQPWATLISGEPGFAQAPDAQTLRVMTQPAASDPLAGALVAGAPVGLLGLEPSTRRRNRVNGTITQSDGAGFVLHVAQSFGNCPQYIRKREVLAGDSQASTSQPVAEPPAHTLDDEAQSIIASADTFFVATYFASDAPDGAPDAAAGGTTRATHLNGGADVSHRGGKPGFVRIDDARTLTWPEFRGNAYFNTLGNLLANLRAGLLFADFSTGDLLHLAGHAEILWDDEAQTGFVGAQRLVRFHVNEMRRVRGALPTRWRYDEVSPTLARTGDWFSGPIADAGAPV